LKAFQGVGHVRGETSEGRALGQRQGRPGPSEVESLLRVGGLDKLQPGEVVKAVRREEDRPAGFEPAVEWLEE